MNWQNQTILLKPPSGLLKLTEQAVSWPIRSAPQQIVK